MLLKCYASFDAKWPHRSRFSVSRASMFLCSNYRIQFMQHKPKVSKCGLASSSSLNVHSFSFSWGLRLSLRTVRFVVVGLLSCKHFSPEKNRPERARGREREREEVKTDVCGGGWGGWEVATVTRIPQRYTDLSSFKTTEQQSTATDRFLSGVYSIVTCFPPSNESGRRVRWSLYPRYNLTTVETMPKPVRISRSHTEDLFLSMLQSLRIA